MPRNPPNITGSFFRCQTITAKLYLDILGEFLVVQIAFENPENRSRIMQDGFRSLIIDQLKSSISTTNNFMIMLFPFIIQSILEAAWAAPPPNSPYLTHCYIFVCVGREYLNVRIYHQNPQTTTNLEQHITSEHVRVFRL